MGSPVETMPIARLDAARRQLRMAIELWFHDGDPVCIHTLASAAHQIVHDLNRQRKGPELLYDLAVFKTKEQKKAFVAQIKRPGNFFKHADRGNPNESVAFDPDLNATMIIFATFGLQYLGEKFTADEIAFHVWHVVRNPELLTDAGRLLFKDSYTVDQIEAVRRIPKREFLERFRRILGARAPR